MLNSGESSSISLSNTRINTIVTQFEFVLQRRDVMESDYEGNREALGSQLLGELHEGNEMAETQRRQHHHMVIMSYPFILLPLHPRRHRFHPAVCSFEIINRKREIQSDGMKKQRSLLTIGRGSARVLDA
jgi:hypothetical protein